MYYIVDSRGTLGPEAVACLRPVRGLPDKEKSRHGGIGRPGFRYFGHIEDDLIAFHHLHVVVIAASQYEEGSGDGAHQ